MSKNFLIAQDELDVGQMKACEIAGEKILLYRLSDGFYVTQAKCPHLGAPLEKGTIVDDCKILCKFHHAEFDIKTGEVCEWANFPPGIQALNFLRGKKNLQTYRVSVEDGKVFIEL